MGEWVTVLLAGTTIVFCCTAIVLAVLLRRERRSHHGLKSVADDAYLQYVLRMLLVKLPINDWRVITIKPDWVIVVDRRPEGFMLFRTRKVTYDYHLFEEQGGEAIFVPLTGFWVNSRFAQPVVKSGHIAWGYLHPDIMFERGSFETEMGPDALRTLINQLSATFDVSTSITKGRAA